MVRKPCCEKEGLKKGRWTDVEDGILTRYIETYGEGSWRSVPKNSGLQRCGKSCRLRWINYLRPDLKRGNITAEEEALIIRLHASMGNRWSLIAGHLPRRTDNEIKNYWNSHLSWKHLTELTDPNDKAREPVCQAEVTAKWKPRRGRSRKRGNIKNMSTNVPVKDDMNMSMSMLGNEELDPIAAEKAMPPDANKESFEITAYINEESLVFTSVHQPSHFNDDHIDILFTLDDALNIKVEETEVDSNLSSVDQKIKLLSDKADKVAANWNESKSLSISSAGDAWDDLDWKGLVNGHKLIDEDEMLSMLWDNGSDFQCKNQL